MLTKNDIIALRGLMREVITDTVPGMIHDALGVNNPILKREIRDEMHALIKASEAGLIREIRATEVRILDAMGSMMDIQIAPRLDEHDEAFVMVKRHLKLA